MPECECALWWFCASLIGDLCCCCGTLGLSPSPNKVEIRPSASTCQTCHGGAELEGCSCGRMWFRGACSCLPADCRVLTKTFLCSLPHLLNFVKTHRGAWSLVLRAATCSAALATALMPCLCARLYFMYSIHLIHLIQLIHLIHHIYLTHQIYYLLPSSI